MKKIYYAGLLAFMLSGNAYAQSELPQLNQQHFQRSFLKNQMAQRLTKDGTNHRGTATATPASALRSTKMDNSVLRALTRSYEPKVANTQNGISLLSKMIYTINGETKAIRQIKERNEYGLPTYEVWTSNDGSILQEVRHTYEMGPQGYWTSWITEEKKPDGNWLQTQRKERKINEQKQLVADRVYSLNADSTKLILISEQEMDYNMDRINKFIQGTLTYSNVTFTKSVRYDNDGTLSYHREYVWNDEFEKFLKIYEATSYSKTMGEVKDDKFIETWYNKNYDGELYLSKEITHFSDGGFINYGFNSFGDTTYVGGNYLDWKKDTPSKGIYTVERNKYLGHQWIANERFTVEGLSDKRKIQKGIPLIVKQENYDQRLNEWTHTNTFNINLINDNIVSIEDNSGLKHYRFAHFDCNVADKKNRIYYDNENQTYLYTTNDFGRTKEYKQCNIKHDKIKTILVNEEDYRISPNFLSKRIIHLYTPGYPTSKPIPELNLQYVNSNGDLVRNEIVCNENKQLVKRTEWTTLKNGKTFVTFKKNCEFNDDGYKITEESYTIENGEQAVKSQTTTETYKELPTGECSQEIITCNDKGEIIEGERNICDANFMMKYYTYSTETQDFELKNEAVGTVIEHTVDGSKVYISRIKDENGKLVNKEKYVYNNSDDTEEIYSWNAETNEWVGISKGNENHWYENNPNIYTHVPEYENLSPEEDLIVPKETIKDRNDYILCDDSREYDWNQEKKTWVLREMYQSKFVKIDENHYHLYQNSIDANYKIADNTYITTNAKNQLSQVKHMMEEESASAEDPNKKEYYTSEETENFTYDDRGRKICNDYINNENDVNILKGKILYEYVDFSFNPTAISEVKVVDDLQISGRNITAAEGALISVYDMSGRCLLRAKHQLTLPSSGLYIVKCGHRSTKVMCK